MMSTRATKIQHNQTTKAAIFDMKALNYSISLSFVVFYLLARKITWSLAHKGKLRDQETARIKRGFLLLETKQAVISLHGDYYVIRRKSPTLVTH